MSDDKLDNRTNQRKTTPPARHKTAPVERTEHDKHHDDDWWLYECSVTAD